MEGIIFENCQVFLKIFLRHVIVTVTCRFKFYVEMALLNFFKHIEPSKEGTIQSALSTLDDPLAISLSSSAIEAAALVSHG